MVKAQENTLSMDTVEYIGYGKFPLASVMYSNYSNSGYNNENYNGEARYSELRASLQAAVPIKKRKVYAHLGGNYTALTIQSTSDRPEQDFNFQFGTISLDLGLVYITENRWVLSGLFTPVISTDFESEVSNNDFLYNISFIATKRKKPFKRYGIGAAYTNRFGRHIIVPVIICEQKSVGHWGFSATIPSYISEFYYFEKGKIGLTASISGNIFNFTDNSGSLYSLDKLGYINVNLGPEFEISLYKSVFFNCNSGLTLWNRVESANTGETRRFHYSTSNRFFITVGLKLLM